MITTALRPRHPALYQINTRDWLHELGRALGRAATLEDVDDASLDRIAADGFDWVWLLGIWHTGSVGCDFSRNHPEWQREYREVLPDFTLEDVCGSPFAVTEYVVHRDFGGPRALERFRKRLSERGLRLMLDFVPNHTALDHTWVRERPGFVCRSGWLSGFPLLLVPTVLMGGTVPVLIRYVTRSLDRLAVNCHEIVRGRQSGDGCAATKRSMAAMPIVVVEPSGQRVAPLRGGWVGTPVGPLVQQG
jgi:hypothetical protein